MAKFSRGDRVVKAKLGDEQRGMVTEVSEGHFRGTGYVIRTDEGRTLELYEDEIVAEPPRSAQTSTSEPAKKRWFGR